MWSYDRDDENITARCWKLQKLRNSNHYYVDKTNLIREILVNPKILLCSLVRDVSARHWQWVCSAHSLRSVPILRCLTDWQSPVKRNCVNSISESIPWFRSVWRMSPEKTLRKLQLRWTKFFKQKFAVIIANVQRRVLCIDSTTHGTGIVRSVCQKQ